MPYPPIGVRISPNDNKRQDIVRIDPDTGDEQVTTTISPIDNLDAEMGILGGRRLCRRLSPPPPAAVQG